MQWEESYSSLQDAFDQSDGLSRIAPMLSEHMDPVTHLAGLHLLASFIYCRRRCQFEMSKQLSQAGLYESALTLLKSHSQMAAQGVCTTRRDTLDWLEACHVANPTAPLPEGHPVNLETIGNMGNSKGNFAQSSPRAAFQPDVAHQPHRLLLTTAQTMPAPTLTSPPATTGHSPLLRQHGGNLPPDEQKAGNGGSEMAGNTESHQEREEDLDLERMSGDVTLADQVVLAALEVLFKLSSNRVHLQGFR